MTFSSLLLLSRKVTPAENEVRYIYEGKKLFSHIKGLRTMLFFVTYKQRSDRLTRDVPCGLIFSVVFAPLSQETSTI